MRLISFFVFTLICSGSLLAQTGSTESEGTDEIIYLKEKSASAGFYNPATNMNSGGSFPSYTFRIGENGETLPVGFYGDNLRPYLLGNEAALAELDTFKKKRSWMLGGVGIVALGAVTVAITGINEGTGEYTFDPRSGSRTEKQKLKPAGLVGVGIMITGLVVSATNGIGATKYVVRAVEVHNNRTSPKPVSTVLRIAPKVNTSMAGIGITLSW